MKEATAELNSTVIILAAVAGLSAVFFMLIWPMVKEGLKDDARCSEAYCDHGYNDNGMAWCKNPNVTNPEPFECPYRG